ncbi:CaiB/BaiF CoA transferase family protein [Cryptosporangium sp. NPDC048952]|uniref:CaiB/BaiF CoA transferase family protein n=1 Tax=Cryptosporangium sp. NPDC048952 TaxID=3363961 RepID=UPI0037116645
MVGPLSGIRVLELGSFIAGPFAGQLLADYGAEVIKIEAPVTGDPMRHWGVTRDGASLWWPAIARNKKSVTLDLRTERGQQLARTIASECDIVLENFRPGTLDRWGLDYASVSAGNAGVIYVHVSGYGQTGPKSGEAGFGSIAEAVGGIRFTTGAPDRAPARTGISLGDSLASLFAVVGALAALAERGRSGRGQEVDVAIYEAVFALMESLLADYVHGGVLRTRTGPVLPGVAPSNVYPTADGEEVVIAGNADTVFRRLADVMGRPELATDSRFASHSARGAHAETLDGLVADWTRGLGTAEALATLANGGVPAGLISTAATILGDEHFAARDMVVQRKASVGGDELDVPMNGVVPKFSRTPGAIEAVGPSLGEHTATILRDLAGLSDADLTALRAEGIV